MQSDAFMYLASQFSVIFFRMGALTFFLPGFGETYVPKRVKLLIAFCISALVFPIIAPQIEIRFDDSFNAFPYLMSEALIGVLWGTAVRMIIYCLQMAGSIMSQATSLAQIFGGTANMDAQPAMGHILVISGVAFLSILGMHEIYLIYILNTYDVTPIGAFMSSAEVAKFGSGSLARTFALAFQLSAAALTATLLYNIILGVINRAMPQLLVSFVGAPAITAGGLFLLFIMAPTILNIWMIFVEDVISSPSLL